MAQLMAATESLQHKGGNHRVDADGRVTIERRARERTKDRD